MATGARLRYSPAAQPMRRPDALLAPDERVVLRTGLHAASFGGALGFTAFVLGVVALIVARNELATQTVVLLWLAGIAIVLLGWVMPLLRWRATTLVVTPQRCWWPPGAASARRGPGPGRPLCGGRAVVGRAGARLRACGSRPPRSVVVSRASPSAGFTRLPRARPRSGGAGA